MNKKEYAEFHRLLAMLIYDYNVTLNNYNLTENNRNEIEEILAALEKVMKICIIDGSRY